MSKGSEGIVLEERGEYAKVCLKRRSGCQGCAMRHSCKLPQEGESGFFELFFGAQALEILALNEAGAESGDRCLVQLGSRWSIVKGSFFLYLLPGVLFILGLLVGERWYQLSGGFKVLAQLLSGLILMSLGFVLATFYGRKRRTEFTPIITQVLEKRVDINPDPFSSQVF